LHILGGGRGPPEVLEAGTRYQAGIWAVPALIVAPASSLEALQDESTVASAIRLAHDWQLRASRR
jgi:hypothetical protein